MSDLLFCNPPIKNKWFRTITSIITTEKLGTTLVSEAIYENPDGTPKFLDKDYFGNYRDEKKPYPALSGKLRKGSMALKSGN